MPKIDLTVTISVILAFCAIVTPSITTFLNNRHLYRMEKLRLEHSARKESLIYQRSIYEDYLKGVGGYIHYGDSNAQTLYGKAYPLALVYFPSNLIPSISSINELLRSSKMDEATTELERITPQIKQILQQL